MSLFFELNEANRALREKETIINDVIVDKDIDNTRKNLISEAANSIYDTPALHIDESVTDDASDFPSLSKAILKDGTRVLGSGLAYDTNYIKLSKYSRSELDSMGVTWVDPTDRTNFGICKDLRLYGYKHNALLPRAYKMNYSTVPFGDIVYGLNVYIATDGSSIYYSEDGKEWKRTNLVDAMIGSVAFGSNVFVATTVSGVYYSSDGMNWTLSSITSISMNVGYNFSKFVVTTNTGIYYSTDGISWTVSNVTSGSFNQLLFVNNTWFVTDVTNNKLRKSSDGVTWVDCTIGNVENMDIKFANDIYVAATNNGLYYSTDGTSWTASNYDTHRWFCITYFNNVWVAGGIRNGLYYSTDGKTWADADFNYGMCISFITFDDKLIACSQNNTGIVYSTNGISWSYSNLTNGSFCGVVQVNDTLVAASISDGGIYYSTDGETWRNTNVSSGSFISLKGFDNLCLVMSDTGIYYIDMTRKILGYKRKSNEEVVNLTSYLMKTCDIAVDTIHHVEIQSNEFYYIAYIYHTSSEFKVYVSTDLITWTYFGDNNIYINGIGNIFSIAKYGMSATMYLNPIDTSKKKTIKLAISESIRQTTEVNPMFGYKDMMTFISTYGNIFQLGDKNEKLSPVDEIIGTPNIEIPNVEIPKMISGTIKVSGGFNSIDNIGFIPEKAFLTFRGDNEFVINSGEIIVSRNAEFPMPINDNGKAWTRSNITSEAFNCVYYANNIWVAGSQTMGLYYSADGKVWTQSNITSGYFLCVYYGNNTWVAGSGSDKGLYYSTDGKTWTKSNITSGSFGGVYYANNTWVAIGSGGKGIYYSTDGKTWTKSNITSGRFRCVYYANNTWVTGSGSDTGLYYSTDGKTWTQSNITSGNFVCVYYGNNTWVAGKYSNNGIYYSTNGKTWTQSNITIGAYFRCVYYANNLWVAGSSGKGLYYSTDGITWTQSNITKGNFYCVYYDNNTWVTGIYYSTDGKTWTQSHGGGSFDEVYYANNTWVACNGNGLYYSLCNQLINVYSKSIVTPVFESFTESTVNGSTVYESSNDLAGYIIYFGVSPDQQDMNHMIFNAIIVGDSILIFIPPDIITGAYYIDYRIFGRNISAEETDDMKLSEGIIEVDPIVIAKINTGVNQKLVSPGEGTGAMMYSMDGIHYSLNIPEVSTSGDYMVYYYSAKNAMYRKSLVGQLSVHIVDPEHWVLAAGLGKGVLYSGDGNEWFQSNLKNTYVDEIFQMSDESLVAVTSDGLYYSNKNGAEWEQCVVLVDGNPIAVSAINMEFGMVVSNGQTFVAGGANNNGLYYGGANARPDEGSSLGKYFTASNITTGTFDLICCVNDTWFAAGEGHLYCSTNGVTWTESNLSSSYVYSICASTNNKFVVSCSTGLYYSTDYGVTWIHSNKTTDNFGEVVYGNNYCVALTTDSTGVYYSEGGVTWNQSNLTSGRFGVVYNHGIWILGSDDNNGLYYSTDGKSWTQSNITTGYIYDINNFGIFIAISSDGILYSTDGKTWSTSNIVTGNIQSVSESNNLFVATTNDNSGIYYSADGQYWTLSDMKSNNFSGVLFASRSDL